MQHLEPYDSLDPVPQHDVQTDWSGPLAPPGLLLDYVYGVAVIKLWAANGIQQMLKKRHEENFAPIPCLQKMPLSSKDETSNDSDHNNDPDYMAPGAGHACMVVPHQKIWIPHPP